LPDHKCSDADDPAIDFRDQPVFIVRIGLSAFDRILGQRQLSPGFNNN
jgi:hypothetical protein